MRRSRLAVVATAGSAVALVALGAAVLPAAADDDAPSGTTSTTSSTTSSTSTTSTTAPTGVIAAVATDSGWSAEVPGLGVVTFSVVDGVPSGFGLVAVPEPDTAQRPQISFVGADGLTHVFALEIEDEDDGIVLKVDDLDDDHGVDQPGDDDGVDDPGDDGGHHRRGHQDATPDTRADSSGPGSLSSGSSDDHSSADDRADQVDDDRPGDERDGDDDRSGSGHDDDSRSSSSGSGSGGSSGSGSGSRHGGDD